MKKYTIYFCLIVLLFSSCAKDKTINGKLYHPYGLVNENDIKVDSVYYEVPLDNIICGVIFSETFIVPGYIIGWNLYEAKSIKNK